MIEVFLNYGIAFLPLGKHEVIVARIPPRKSGCPQGLLLLQALPVFNVLTIGGADCIRCFYG
jgi:hypothetical protein